MLINNEYSLKTITILRDEINVFLVSRGNRHALNWGIARPF